MADRFPGTFRQQWYYGACDNGWSDINLPIVLRLTGDYDKGLLQEALLDLAARHGALRTTLHETDHGVVQEVDSAARLELEELPLGGNALDERNDWEPVLAAINEPFHVHGGALIRARLCVGGTDGAILVLSAHHAICDGWSTRVLYRDLIEIYRAKAAGQMPNLPVLELQFADYAAWEDSVELGEDERYWTELLSTAHGRLRLGAGEAADSLPAKLGVWPLGALPASDVERLNELATERGTTLSRVLSAAVLASLYPYLDDEITIGITTSNRDLPELWDVVGDLADELPVRIKVADRPALVELVDRVHHGISDAYDHQLPMRVLSKVMLSNPQRPAGPFFRVQFNYLPEQLTQTRPVDLGRGQAEEIAAALALREYSADDWWDGFSVLEYMHHHDEHGAVHGYLLANLNSIPADVAAQLADGWHVVVRQASSDPDEPTGRTVG